MKERDWIELIVERVVGEALENHAAQLRSEIVRRVREEVASQSPDVETASNRGGAMGASVDLAHAVSEIQLGTSQREILRALLDTSARYAARVALFVVKGSHATGWQGRGFANNDRVKDFALDGNAPAVLRAIGRAIGDRQLTSAPLADLDQRFLDEFGTPASEEVRIFPLMLKDKVAALVYADSGAEDAGLLDVGSLELLVLSTSAWLEVNSLRKQAHKEPSAATADVHSVQAANSPSESASAAAPPAFNDPFAAHTPAFASGHAKAAAASASAPPAVEFAPPPSNSPVQSEIQSPLEVQSSVAVLEPVLAAPASLGQIETHATPETPAAPSLSPEDQDTHRKAQRFARLLVDEIKLYNQAKVAEGRKNKDLYDRLHEVIQKSRGTYQKRYGNTVASSANYFEHEIIKSLAEDDPSIMGANFRQ